LIFTKIGTDVKTPKVKMSCLGSTLHHLFPLFCPHNLCFRSRGPENSCKY